MKDDNRIRITKAAAPVFARFGFKRTTMNDIAQEAGVSRSTVYGLFADKEEILQASMVQYLDDAIAGINEQLDEAKSLGDQLRIVFEWVVVRGFEMTQKNPTAKDFVDGVHPVGGRAFITKYQEIIDLVTKLLTPYGPQIQAAGMQIEDLAQLLCTSSGSLKHAAQNVSLLRKMHADLIALTVAGLR